MKEIFYELIKEANNGRVLIDDEEWNYSFNTIIKENDKEKLRLENKDNIVTLIIKNEDKFLSLLEEYINLEQSMNRKSLYKDNIKWLIANLFANATTEDFINPETFIKRYIKYLKDNTFNYTDNGVNVDISNIVPKSDLIIKRESNSTMMETPYKMTFMFKNNPESYILPSIYYGIDNNTCYIYGIQASKKNYPNSKYTKKINRLLYKINEGVEDSKEYYAYKNEESDYYPEDNISDVTMSFVMSLNLFINLLQSENIEEVKVVSYLPVRYNSRRLAGLRTNREDFLERNDKIQTNLTNKLIRTFRRLESQNKNIKIIKYPYEIDEFITIKVSSTKEKIDNDLLKESSNSINLK